MKPRFAARLVAVALAWGGILQWYSWKTTSTSVLHEDKLNDVNEDITKERELLTGERVKKASRTTGKEHVIWYKSSGSPRNLAKLNKSLSSLFTNFNRRFRKRVIIFHDMKIGPAKFLENIDLPDEDKKLLEFQVLNETIPEKFNELRKNGTIKDIVFKAWFPGHHLMCVFMFGTIFDQPILNGVEYYWRLDDDSYIESEITYDIFDFMARSGYIYGYRRYTEDYLMVTRGLLEFTKSFADENKIVATHGHLRDILAKDDVSTTRCPSFSGNFEILHVPTFKHHPGIQKFRAKVESSFGSLQYRWGDGPLRYLSLALFFDLGNIPFKSNYSHFFCDIAYDHQGLSRARCAAPQIMRDNRTK